MVLLGIKICCLLKCKTKFGDGSRGGDLQSLRSHRAAVQETSACLCDCFIFNNSLFLIIIDEGAIEIKRVGKQHKRV